MVIFKKHVGDYMPFVSTVIGLGRIGQSFGILFSSDLDKKVYSVAQERFTEGASTEQPSSFKTRLWHAAKQFTRGVIELIPLFGNIILVSVDFIPNRKFKEQELIPMCMSGTVPSFSKEWNDVALQNIVKLEKPKDWVMSTLKLNRSPAEPVKLKNYESEFIKLLETIYYPQGRPPKGTEPPETEFQDSLKRFEKTDPDDWFSSRVHRVESFMIYNDLNKICKRLEIPPNLVFIPEESDEHTTRIDFSAACNYLKTCHLDLSNLNLKTIPDFLKLLMVKDHEAPKRQYVLNLQGNQIKADDLPGWLMSREDIDIEI